ncbi:kinase-like protein [Lophium mytilinum]|uniref:Kinase-like protein n=1 Tax=Lophium mytilinum TaxID=390894 RepID=A0A6A6R9M9_9PEZI|nr:kinase-like protein [Lophium mytilinum]
MSFLLDSSPAGSKIRAGELTPQFKPLQSLESLSIGKAVGVLEDADDLVAAMNGAMTQNGAPKVLPPLAFEPELATRSRAKFPKATVTPPGVVVSIELDDEHEAPTSKQPREASTQNVSIDTTDLDRDPYRLSLTEGDGGSDIEHPNPELDEEDLGPTEYTTPGPRDALTADDPARLAIRGQEFLVVTDSKHGRPALSETTAITVITDLGDEAAHRNFKRRQTDSFPLASSYDVSLARLLDQVFGAVKVNHWKGQSRGFMPTPKLLKLIIPKTVEPALESYDSWLRKRPQPGKPKANLQEVASKICGDFQYYEVSSDTEDEHLKMPSRQKSYRKIFAILLLLERSHRISSFVEEGVCDADLPLALSKPRKPFKLEMRRKNAAPESPPCRCFKKWRSSTISRFEETQWTFLAPYFAPKGRRRVSHYRLQPQTVLPFTSYNIAAPPGGNGQVYRVEIPSDQHGFPMAEGSKHPADIFAVKELSSVEKADFKREVAILKSFSTAHAHPHLITLLATYEQAGRYHLIFPWAEADLLGYWKFKNSNPPKDRDTVLWLVEQCQGLAEGLSQIHKYNTTSGSSLLHLHHSNSLPDDKWKKEVIATQGERMKGMNSVRLYGRHGDIKPQNILWFPDPKGGKGILKITDFGISHFSTQHSVSTRSGTVPNSPSYRAPECDLSNPDISISYDIWTLGCVYLEFIAWYFGGWAYVDEFKKKRLAFDDFWGGMKTDTFFTIVKDEDAGTVTRTPKVKESVTKVSSCSFYMVSSTSS